MYRILSSLIDKNHKIIPIICKNVDKEKNKYNKELVPINDKEIKSKFINEYNEDNNKDNNEDNNKDNFVNK